MEDEIFFLIVVLCICGAVAGLVFGIFYYVNTSPVTITCNILEKELFLTQTLNKTSLEFAYDNCLYLTEKIMEARNN